MPRKSLFAAFLLLLSLACPDAVFAAQKLLITDSLDYTPLGHYFDLLEDPGGKLGVAEVAGGDMEDKFTPGKSDIYSMGFTTSVYWLRMDIENGANETKDAVIEMPVAWFDNLKMFLPAAGGGYHILQSGDRIPFYQRSFPHRDHLFRFTMRPGERQTIYIRAEAEDAMVLPFYFWTAEAYHRHDGRINMVFGTLYGMLVALMVYNLFVYYSVKDKSYLYYVLYIFGWLIFLFSTNGSAFEMLWPNMPYWGNRAPLFGAVVANLFAGLFTREFLNIRQTIPKYDRAVKAGIGFCIFMVPFSVLWPAYRHTDMLGTTTLTMIFGPVLFAGAILCYRKGVRQARFYLLAWLFPMLAMMIFGLGCFNILPFNFLTTHAIDFGASLEALLLSLALADKISIMREENEMAEERVRETLRRANEELEGKVLERTALLTVAKETAEKATRMKDQFVSLVSHDLRGPISSIKGLMSLSLNEGRSAGELRELAFKCHRASGALIEMIEKLLDISRLQTGSITLKKNFFDAALTVRDILERVGQLVESKGIRLIDEMPEGRVLYADKTLFGEVVLNLLTNAIKFTPTGGSITIGMPEETAIAVTDTGGGIPEKMRADIFRHEVKTSMQGTEGEKGTGLGLPYCHDIMKAHNGTLELASTGAVGTAFLIRLPVMKVSVLLVDDQEVHRATMKEELAKLGSMTVLEAEDGAKAMIILKKHTPNLIITDLQMPLLDGFELISRVRQTPLLADIPIIVATSEDSSSTSGVEVKRKIFALGATDFIVKPIVSKDFIPRVKRFLP